MSEFHLIAAALTLLQAFDGWTTYTILKRGGREMNKVVKALMEKVGVYPALVMVKVGAAFLAWFLALAPIAHDSAYEIRAGMFLLLTALYMWVVSHNWNVLKNGAN